MANANDQFHRAFFIPLSAESTAPIDPTVAPPTAPGTTSADRTVTVYWTASADASEGYEVYQRVGDTDTVVGTTTSTVTTFLISNLTNLTTYYFAVSAIKGTVRSEKTAYVSGTPIADIINPNPPEGTDGVIYDPTFSTSAIPDYQADWYNAALERNKSSSAADGGIEESQTYASVYARGLNQVSETLFSLYMLTKDKAIILLMANLLEPYYTYLTTDASKSYKKYNGSSFGTASRFYNLAADEIWWDDFQGDVRKFLYIRRAGPTESDNSLQGTDYHMLDAWLFYATFFKWMYVFDVNKGLSRGLVGRPSLKTMADEVFSWLVDEFWPWWKIRTDRSKAAGSDSTPMKSIGAYSTTHKLWDFNKYIAHCWISQVMAFQHMGDWAAYRNHADKQLYADSYTAMKNLTMKSLAYATAPNGHKIVMYAHEMSGPLRALDGKTMDEAYTRSAHMTRYLKDFTPFVNNLTLIGAGGFADGKLAKAMANLISQNMWKSVTEVHNKVNSANKFLDGSDIVYDTWEGGSRKFTVRSGDTGFYNYGSDYMPDGDKKDNTSSSRLSTANSMFTNQIGRYSMPFDPTSDHQNIKRMKLVMNQYGRGTTMLLGSNSMDNEHAAHAASLYAMVAFMKNLDMRDVTAA